MFISDLKYFILTIKSIEKMNVGPDTMTSPTGLSISALVVIMLGGVLRLQPPPPSSLKLGSVLLWS